MAANDSSGGGGAAAPASLPTTGGTIGRLTDTLGRLYGSIGAADNVDPTLNAAKEISDVVSPLGRGLFSMFGAGAERKKDRWYGRILKALTAKKPGVEVAGGKSSTSVLDVGGLGAAAGAFSGGAGILGKGLGLLGKGGKGLLRRVPLLGALLAGGSALASIFGDDDPTKSAEENRAGRYRGVGEAGGMLAGGLSGAALGAAIGTAILPGLGTAIGGFLGGVGGALLGEEFGGKVGEWTKTLIDSDIGGTAISMWGIATAAMGAAWDLVATDAKSAWRSTTDGISTAWTSFTAEAKSAWDSFMALPGVKPAVDRTKKVLGRAGTMASEEAKSAGSTIKDAASRAGLAIWEDAKSAVSALTPNTIKRAITAGAAAGTQAKAGYDEARGNGTSAPAPSGALQLGARAAGGAAGVGINKVLQAGPGYNVTENADGTVTRQDGARNWRNNNPGNLEWKPGGFAEQHGAIGSDGRFAIFPSCETGRAAKAALIFESKNYKDKSLTDAISRYAPPSENDTAKYQSSVLGAVGGQNKKMSDYSAAERGAIMDAMQKVEGFKVGRSSVLPAGGYSGVKIATASLPSMQPTNIPSSVPDKLPKMEEVKEPPTRLNSSAGAGRGTVQISIPREVGQNIGDRGIAHVVSGGLGAA